MWSFIIPNKETRKPLTDFRVSTTKVEKYAGIKLWGTLVGTAIEREKKKDNRAMW